MNRARKPEPKEPKDCVARTEYLSWLVKFRHDHDQINSAEYGEWMTKNTNYLLSLKIEERAWLYEQSNKMFIEDMEKEYERQYGETGKPFVIQRGA